MSSVRIALVAFAAVGWFCLLHVRLTLPASVVLGLVGWAVLMSVIAVIQWRRARDVSTPEER